MALGLGGFLLCGSPAPAAAPPTPAAQPLTAAAPPRRVAVLVGVARFADADLPRLAYAGRDVSLFRNWLLDPRGGAFERRDVFVLLNEAANRPALDRLTARLARHTGPRDLVLFYFSTHGFYTDQGHPALALNDTRTTGRQGPDGPILRADTALDRDDLARLLARLPVGRRALVLDVCHGEEVAQGLAGPFSTAGPCPPAQPAAPSLSLAPNAAAPAPALPTSATLVLASCTALQKSWESSWLGSSIFTFFLLEGLDQHHGDLVAAFRYATARTGREAWREKGQTQTPTAAAELPGCRFDLGPTLPGGL